MPQAPLLARIALFLGLSALFAAGCSPVWHQGHRMARDGQFAEATWYWLEVLEEQDALDPAARRGIERYAPDAYRELLDRAQEHEAEERYEASLATYDKLIGLVDALEDRDLLAFEPTTDLQAERTSVLEALARQRYQAGVAAFERGEWLEAVRSWKQAREAREDHADTRERIARAYERQAEEDLEEHRYAAAVEHWLAADEWEPDPERRGWAAAIQAALGRYYLKHGACRAAVESFEAAVPHVINDPTIRQDLATAEDCAEVELVVLPFDQSEGTAVEGTHLGTLVADKLAEQLDTQGSRFVVLIDPAAARGQTVHSTKGTRLRVKGRISQLRVDRPGPERVEKTVQGTLRDLCPGMEGYYTTDDEYCDETVRIRYDLVQDRVALEVSSAVRLVEPTSGEQILTRTLEASAAHATEQAVDFTWTRDDEEQEARVGESPSASVAAIDAEVLALREPPPGLPSDSELVAEAAGSLATRAARAILEQVDHGEEVRPPRALANIRPPLVDPGDIRITPGEAVSQPDPVQQPGPAPAPGDANEARAPADEPADEAPSSEADAPNAARAGERAADPEAANRTQAEPDEGEPTDQADPTDPGEPEPAGDPGGE